jgi:RecA-family ATPase
MMQLAISVADQSGGVKEWLGFPIEQHGPVLYILTDGSHRSLRERIRKISGYLKVPYPKDLIIQLNQGVYSTWKDQVDRLIKIRRPLMIVLDSLAMSSDTGDENQAEDQKEFAKILQLWSLEQDLAFCLIHHTNKAAMNNAFHQNNFRGSSYWIGIISSMLEFRKSSNRTNQYKLVKSRDGSPDAQTVREVAYEEYTPSAPGRYNLNLDKIVAGYKYVGLVTDNKSPGRKSLTTWAGDVFQNGETKTYRATLEAIQTKYGRSQSWAKETLADWKDLGYVTSKRNADGTKSYTFKR